MSMLLKQLFTHRAVLSDVTTALSLSGEWGGRERLCVTPKESWRASWHGSIVSDCALLWCSVEVCSAR